MLQKPLGREEIPLEHVSEAGGAGKLTTLMLGAAAGSERIYVNLEVLSPGGVSAKYHSHSSQEEFFFVLKGAPTLRLDEKIFHLRPGDFFAKPAGKGIAHQFVNETEEPCEIMDIGTRDPEDICIFPDEGVALVKSLQKVFSLESGIKGWTSTPTSMD